MGTASVHPEITGQREMEYSDWRREIGNKEGNRGLYVTNVSWVEWRKGKPVAIIETTETTKKNPTIQKAIMDWRFRVNRFQYDVTKRVADALNVPAYAVAWTGDIVAKADNVRFLVWKLITGNSKIDKMVEMTLAQYEQFIKTLPDDLVFFGTTSVAPSAPKIGPSSVGNDESEAGVG